jgi:hypothetical protein
MLAIKLPLSFINSSKCVGISTFSMGHRHHEIAFISIPLQINEQATVTLGIPAVPFTLIASRITPLYPTKPVSETTTPLTVIYRLIFVNIR